MNKKGLTNLFVILRFEYMYLVFSSKKYFFLAKKRCFYCVNHRKEIFILTFINAILDGLAGIIFVIKISTISNIGSIGEFQYPKFMFFLILTLLILGGICILIFMFDILLTIGILKQKFKLVDAWIHIKKIHVLIKVCM